MTTKLEGEGPGGWEELKALLVGPLVEELFLAVSLMSKAQINLWKLFLTDIRRQLHILDSQVASNLTTKYKLFFTKFMWARLRVCLSY